MTAEGRKNTIGRYEVLGDLAVGGMAEILLGRLVGPSGFERLVVIKRIFRHLAKDPEFVGMFLDEARTVARINHPNVVQVNELGRDGDELFLTMEYLEGESVSGLLRRCWAKGITLQPALAAHIVAEACKGLQAAHDLVDADGTPLDLVHRDVSPQNLFVTYSGSVKVLDFGIAKLANRDTKTEPGQIKGKFAYMSPEQAAGKNLDRRSDIFSLGVVLYEALTGCRLFARDGDLATLRALCEDPIAPPSRVVETVPKAIEAVCMTALSRRRDQRYASCAEMRRDLLAAIRAEREADDPELALAALMQSLYPDRIEEKRELLRRARLGQAIDRAPSAETDDGIELPPAADRTVGQFTAPSPALGEPETKAHASRRVWTVIAPGAIALVLGASVSWWYATKPPASGASPAEAPATSAEPRAAASSPAPAVEPEVSLHVTAKPGGTVTLDDAAVGETPVDVKLPRSTRSSVLRVSKPGYETYEQTIVLDADQRLVVTLTPARSTGGTKPRANPPAAPPSAQPPAAPATAPPRPEIL